jgi:uncharacterized protein YndB with AHSA1/START domain
VTEPAFVRLVEVFDAPRERVFAAWTEPEQLESWWGPGRFKTTRAEVDLRPGGRYELHLEPGGMRLVGEFREVVAPERLVYTWQWVAGVSDTRESLVTVEFRDLGAQTEVVLLQDSFAGPGPLAMYGAGWASGLAKLGTHLGSEEAA